jgi:methionyl-tRNA formyltransferase
LKILLCLNQDIYCIAAFNYLLPAIKNHQISIYFSNQVGIAPTNQNLKILQNCERDLAIGNIGLVAQKSGIAIDFQTFLTFEKIQQNFTIFNFNNINQDGFDYLSKNWQPDLIISIRFGQIFKEQIIALPRFGIINLHSGILPNYRGILATFWSMFFNENEIGTTLHFVNDGSIDTGDIIAITKNQIDYNQSLLVNIFKLYPNGTKTIADFIDKLNRNLSIKTTKQNQSCGQYFSYPNDRDIEKILSRFNNSKKLFGL